MPSYDVKIIQSGNIVEVYSYEKPIDVGFSNPKSKGQGRSSAANDEDKQANREKVYNRARTMIRRLVNTNVEEYSKFVTLTFGENVQDIKTANYEFKKFRQRLEYKLGVRLKYLVVVEFQKRGAIHYHVVMFNCPYIRNKDLKAIWGNGFVRINKIDNVDNVGAYVCKYMTKVEDDRLAGKKMYFTSRNLDKPIEITDKKIVENLARSLPFESLVYNNVFESEYNTVNYTQYNLNKLTMIDPMVS